jgi:ABC-2 type transport system ATP-binding protein
LLIHDLRNPDMNVQDTNVLERPAAPARHHGDAALAIEVRDLIKTYPGDVRALDGLSFTVEAGTVFGLLGPNGAGKSTTVKILTTLARADSGAASVAGVDVRARPEQVRRKIGVVGQRSGADPMATGRENLVLTGRIQGLRGRELPRRAGELLGRFGLADAADRAVRTYSGGMRRRLDVAMGLVHRPEVLFLDEPTAGLDPESRSAMWEEIARLSGVEGLTILLTTHYLDEADRLADRLAVIDRGRVVVTGAPEELKGELRGDAVHVELREQAEPGLLRAALDRVPAIREIRVDGRRLSVRADDGATAVPLMLAALDDAGVAVGAVTVARPSLDDVYLRHAGRRFAEADQPTSPAPIAATTATTATGGSR